MKSFKRLLARHAAADDRGLAVEYFTATLLFGVGLAARFAASAYLPAEGFPFLSFFPAVVIAAFLTSIGPALWCAFLSTVAAWYFFMTPQPGAFPISGRDAFALAFFGAVLVVDCSVISVMKNAMSRLKIAEEKLILAATQKTDFINVLAHELRTPLQIVSHAALRIKRKPEGDLLALSALVERQARRMARLIEDLLDSTRVATGKLQVDLRAIDLCTLLRDASEALLPVLAARDQKILLDLPDSLVEISGDALRLTQVFENLVSNASKFSARNSNITVSLRPDQAAGTAVILVRDLGKGLLPNQLNEIFGMYTQVSKEDARLGGIGLGLALSRHIVELHAGTIAAASAGLEMGTTMKVELPLQGTAVAK